LELTLSLGYSFLTIWVRLIGHIAIGVDDIFWPKCAKLEKFGWADVLSQNRGPVLGGKHVIVLCGDPDGYAIELHCRLTIKG